MAASYVISIVEFRNEGSRDLVRQGYRIRLAEERIQGRPILAARGKVDEILRSKSSSQEKTDALIEYLDTHGTIGLGDPIRPYVLVRFDEIREVCERLVGSVIKTSSAPTDELQTELYHRLVAYGYAYRVAEDLIRPHDTRLESLSVSDATRALP